MFEKINSILIDEIAEDEIIFSYHGPFDCRTRADIGGSFDSIKEKYPDEGKKLFKIFVEMAVNIYTYSAERHKVGDNSNAGAGSIVLYKRNNSFFISTVNKIKNEDAEILIKRCEKINSLNRIEQREFKRDMSMMPRKSNGNANIGLIHISLISSNPLNFKVVPFDDEHKYVTLTVKVNY